MRVTRKRVQPADQQTVLRDGPLLFGGHQFVGGLHDDIGDADTPRKSAQIGAAYAEIDSACDTTSRNDLPQ